ncbi:hypothetical protein OJP16_06220 [Campylobacter lari]|uniref:hypothetical protein n=1 Tax=Campylobacter lari TaxID=201 RepID=UPI0021E6CFC3|nr:hypothetical protein [Campylobacter lari]MCV3353314.1 hypothetical protein [Campylobacter lari]MCV3545401.1 hypothetical protein [Campylobacter lari]MCW0225788.1 hypothetical protein [Campylobacter lari]MCW0244937.1 hypothetical protein [Campylobacter lari]
MTAYVHIGIPKTGTTSIQNFLKQNYDLLIREGYLYPKSLRGFEEQYSREWFQHRELASIIKKSKVSGLTVEDTEKLKLFREEIFGFQKVIISSELLYDSLIDFDCILHCKNILKELGFKKIKIIIYLREPAELFQSICSQSIKNCYDQHVCFKLPEYSGILNHRCSYSKNLFNWGQVFGKENLIVKLFDKSEFVEQNLLKDFVSCLGINWNEWFVIPDKTNESLDVVGSEILLRINKRLPLIVSEKNNFLRGNLLFYFEKYFSDSKIKITPPKKLYCYYIDYFEESNEWIRKEFFPHKERLFPKNDLTNYKENYELKEMKPEYWDKIADFIVDIVSNKNQTIQDNLTQIHLMNNQLSFYVKYGTAKTRIQKQLSYKLGQAMIVNSKSFLGYIRMPFVLSYIKDKHNQEQKIYQEKIKQDPSLKLPSLEDYPDYKEALKEKECLTYKLGQALIKANKTWYGGGYIKLLFEVGKLKREFKSKKI